MLYKFMQNILYIIMYIYIYMCVCVYADRLIHFHPKKVEPPTGCHGSPVPLMCWVAVKVSGKGSTSGAFPVSISKLSCSHSRQPCPWPGYARTTHHDPTPNQGVETSKNQQEFGEQKNGQRSPKCRPWPRKSNIQDHAGKFKDLQKHSVTGICHVCRSLPSS